MQKYYIFLPHLSPYIGWEIVSVPLWLNLVHASDVLVPRENI